MCTLHSVLAQAAILVHNAGIQNKTTSKRRKRESGRQKWRWINHDLQVWSLTYGIKRFCFYKRPRRLLESFKSFVVVFTGSWKNVQPVPMAFEIVYLPAQVGKVVQGPWVGIQEQEIYRMCIELLRSLIHFLMSRQDAYNCTPIAKQNCICLASPRAYII